MSLKFILETVFLLAAAQLFLGALGYLTRGMPWLGLVLLPMLVWVILRVGIVLRDELKRLQKKGAEVVPVGSAVFVTLLWQLPALVTVPLWAPSGVTQLWQGAVLPLSGIFGYNPGNWLWLATLVEAALFIWVVTRPEPKRQVQLNREEAYQRVVGEWAIARRRDDVLFARGKKTEE